MSIDTEYLNALHGWNTLTGNVNALWCGFFQDTLNVSEPIVSANSQITLVLLQMGMRHPEWARAVMSLFDRGLSADQQDFPDEYQPRFTEWSEAKADELVAAMKIRMEVPE